MIEFNKRNFRSWAIMGINPSIWSIAFLDIAQSTENVAVFTADLARYSGLERTFKTCPDRCFNLGIAEQNMLSVAAGMAMEGTQSWMTTYAPFMTFRCADQFRHFMGDINLNMKAIGSAAGLSAGLSGSSLLAINDIAFARSIPNLVVLTPADCTEAIKMVIAMSKSISPMYMRFCGAVNLPIVYDQDYDFQIGKAVFLQRGEKIAIITCGTTIVNETQKAIKLIKERTGIKSTLINMHTIKPIDKQCILDLVTTHNLIVTVEEHNVIGGLGSAVAEVLSQEKASARQVFIGIKDKIPKLGSRQYMLEQCGLLADSITETIINNLYNS